MKKHTAKKLRLDRETLAPLQDDLLRTVAGGYLPPTGTTVTTILSRVVCPPSLPLCAGK